MDEPSGGLAACLLGALGATFELATPRDQAAAAAAAAPPLFVRNSTVSRAASLWAAGRFSLPGWLPPHRESPKRAAPFPPFPPTWLARTQRRPSWRFRSRARSNACRAQPKARASPARSTQLPQKAAIHFGAPFKGATLASFKGALPASKKREASIRGAQTGLASEASGRRLLDSKRRPQRQVKARFLSPQIRSASRWRLLIR